MSRRLRCRASLVSGMAILTLVSAACGSAVTTSTSKVAADNAILTIADFDPFSGENATYGFTEEAGCVPAVNLINTNGGVLGHKLQCTIVDNRGDPADAVPAAHKLLATTPNLVAIVDSNSGLLTATTPLFNAAHIPELSLGGDVPFDKSTYEYFWRTIPGDDVNGYAVAAYIKSRSFTKAAAMFSTDEAAQGNLPGLVAGLETLGVGLALNQGLAVNQSSYQTEIHRMVAATPDVMTMESGPQTAGVLYGQMKQAGALLPTVLTAGADNTDFDKAVIAAIGTASYQKNFVKVLQSSASSGLAWEAFDKALMSAGNAVKDASTHEQDTYSEAAYDNVSMIALAMLAARSTDPKVFNPFIGKVTQGQSVVHTFAEGKAAIAAGKTINYVGVEGAIHFDRFHNSAGSWAVFEPVTHKILGRLTADQIQQAEGS